MSIQPAGLGICPRLRERLAETEVPAALLARSSSAEHAVVSALALVLVVGAEMVADGSAHRRLWEPAHRRFGAAAEQLTRHASAAHAAAQNQMWKVGCEDQSAHRRFWESAHRRPAWRNGFRSLHHSM